ncbi:MAG: DNA mismatch repair protein MutS [Phycisphaerales bacterium]|nr:DNA mismatch repair protein MutS [Phycisphaerales bacterium]
MDCAPAARVAERAADGGGGLETVAGGLPERLIPEAPTVSRRRAARSKREDGKPAVAKSVRAPEDDLTPAMRQWHEQKRIAGEAILLFRMGDFYELFHGDAELGARVLGLTLTSRDGGQTPLAGIPYHALPGYLSKLVAAGYRVAISEQVEDARQAKGVIRREIVRVVTPGTLTEDALLRGDESNVLAAACVEGASAGLAALELSTGEMWVQVCPRGRLAEELGRLNPAEVLLADGAPGERLALEDELRDQFDVVLTYRAAADFSPSRAAERLSAQFETRGLEGFGFERVDASLQAAGALLAYANETQRCDPRHIRPPRRRGSEEFLGLDPATLRSLEVERTLRSGQREGSLLAAVDGTRNPMGARLLREWLCYPLREVGLIRARQRAVAALREDAARRAAIREALLHVGDLSRIIGRIGVGRCTPRDLRSLANGLRRLAPLRALLSGAQCEELAALGGELAGLEERSAALDQALRPDAPTTMRDGGIFADGHHAELDRLRTIARDGERWLAEYQQAQQRRTGIQTLKVAFNKVFGYYIEVTQANLARVPDDYTRRQTVKNAERYVTEELQRFEADVLTADSRARELEYELFCALRESLLPWIERLATAAAAVARLDVLAGWAEISVRRGYCTPEFTEDGRLEIVEGRHPVVEAVGASGSFVPNDTRLAARGGVAEGAGAAAAMDDRPGAATLALITGPNMAGKSTYIRQVALLTLLAHCGCDVPARSMALGAVDRIFTRVGAADELARGQSTFMVEMIETANILHNATPRSLVILDEVGRGTSTFDGLALAWAITEHLAARVGCRTLFATHYHEITELAELLDGVENLNVAVRESDETVVFLHRILPGAANRSFGLQVAKIAGVPRGVLERANAVLIDLERHFSREAQRPVLAAAQRRRARQLRLFEEPEEAVIRELRATAGREMDAAAALKLMEGWRRALDEQGPAGGR